jgi:hypothetical protein
MHLWGELSAALPACPIRGGKSIRIVCVWPISRRFEIFYPPPPSPPPTVFIFIFFNLHLNNQK